MAVEAIMQSKGKRGHTYFTIPFLVIKNSFMRREEKGRPRKENK